MNWAFACASDKRWCFRAYLAIVYPKPSQNGINSVKTRQSKHEDMEEDKEEDTDEDRGKGEILQLPAGFYF